MSPRLQITLLGPPEVRLDGEPVKGFVSRKAAALFFYLATTGQAHSRDALAGLLWSDIPNDRARRNLRDVIYNLRRLFTSHLHIDRQTAAFDRTADYALDVETFTAHMLDLQAGGAATVTAVTLQKLNEAAALYKGEFLAGFHAPGAALFTNWADRERERLHRLATGAWGQLAAAHARRGDYPSGVAAAAHLLALEPWREAAHRQLMRLLAWNGQRGAALAQYDKCRRALAEELDVAPAAATTALYEQIREGALAEPPLAENRPDPSPASPPPGRLPAPLSPFVGRDVELAQTVSLLAEPECRLLTIAGPGGVGKTALALQAARTVLPGSRSGERFPHGVYFLPLVTVEAAAAPATAKALALSMAAALDLSFAGAEPAAEQLLDYVRDKDLLLLLDNFEHLTAAVPFLVNLLEGAPRLKLMVTSRVRLNAPGERVIELAGMPVPPARPAAADPDSWQKYDAIRLFRQSARHVRPDFAITTANLTAVARICRLVEGSPLGILLAAAWTRALSCREIAQEIGNSLGFLGSSAGHKPQRHRSLHAVFDYSWRLLAAPEKRALRQLSVFRGGFTRQAAAQVTGATASLLLSLVDNSLVRRALLPADIQAARLELPEVTRQFAAEKLGETGDEEEETRARHAHYYLMFLAERRGDLRGEGQQTALAEIGLEIDNIRAAWRWAIAQGDDTVIGSAIESLFHFYDMRSWFQEGEAAFAQAASCLAALQREGGAAELTVFWGMALARQGWFTFQIGRQREGHDLLEESLVILRPLAEPWAGRRAAAWALVFSLNYLAAVTYHLGDYDEARRLSQEGLSLSQTEGDRYGEAIAGNILSQILYLLGRYPEAKRHGQESLALGREMGNRWHEAFSLSNLGAVAYAAGDYEEAQSLFRESLAIREATEDRRGTAICLRYLGDTARAQGKPEAAMQRYQSSLAMFEEIGNRSGAAASLIKLGHLAAAQGKGTPAQAYFHRALELARRIRTLPKMLDAIGGVASLLVEAEPERALFLAVLVSEHQSATAESKNRAERLISALREKGDGETFASVQARARAASVDAVAIDLS